MHSDHQSRIGLQLTVGVSPAPQPSVADDLRLLKFGLLYGDNVRLCSPVASLLTERKELVTWLSNFDQGNKQVQIALAMIILVAQVLYGADGGKHKELAILEHDSWLGKMTPEGASAVHSLIEDLARLTEAPEEMLEGHALGRDLAELRRALDSGYAELQPITLTRPETAVRSFVEEITNTVLSGKAIPLLDARAGAMLGTLVRSTDHPPAPGTSAHIHLAAQTFERLPVFETATVAELLDLRRELSAPLIRFRSAMISASAEISAAPWDPAFARDAELLILRDVEPGVLELEERIRSSGFSKHLLRPLADGDWKTGAGGAIVLGAAHLMGLPAGVAGMLAAAFPTVPFAARALMASREARQGIERHPLYLYYRLRRAGNPLSSGAGR